MLAWTQQLKRVHRGARALVNSRQRRQRLLFIGHGAASASEVGSVGSIRHIRGRGRELRGQSCRGRGNGRRRRQQRFEQLFFERRGARLLHHRAPRAALRLRWLRLVDVGRAAAVWQRCLRRWWQHLGVELPGNRLCVHFQLQDCLQLRGRGGEAVCRHRPILLPQTIPALSPDRSVVPASRAAQFVRRRPSNNRASNHRALWKWLGRAGPNPQPPTALTPAVATHASTATGRVRWPSELPL